MKTITVVGGGNSAHVLIPLLSKTGMEVNLLTRKPEQWQKTITLEHRKPGGETLDIYEGGLNIISKNPADVIPQADIIILCMPVHAYRLSMREFAPYIDKLKKTYVGTVYGQGGFNWMVEEAMRDFSLDNITSFAFQLIPWICRTEKYGQKGVLFGAKPLNVAAVHPKGDFEGLNRALFSKISYEWFGYGEFSQADNFISLTLSSDNQIIHTSRMYGLFIEEGASWTEKGDVPYFYRDFTQNSADILKNLDEDYSLVREAVREYFPDKSFKFMLDYLSLDRKTNLTSSKTVLDTFNNMESLDAIRTPVVKHGDKWVIDRDNRFFKDDIYYGLCIAKSLAEMFEIEVVQIDGVLYWVQQLLGEKIIENDRLVIKDEIARDRYKYGVPRAYGYSDFIQIID
jgi:hypothetical protein